VKPKLSVWARGILGGGTEFSSQKALANYLREHPAADVSKHSVVESSSTKGSDTADGKSVPKDPKTLDGTPVSSLPKSSDSIKTVDDLKKFAAPLVGHELFTHATRTPGQLEAITKEGIRPSQNGHVSSTPSTEKPQGQIDEHGVRAMGGGYVVFKAGANDGKAIDDHIDHNEKYKERAFARHIDAADIVKVVREIPMGSGGHTIREDHLAAYAAKNQGLNDADVKSLPEKYQRWFHLT